MEVVDMSIIKHVKSCSMFTAILVAAILVIGSISEVPAQVKGFDSPEAVFNNLVESSNTKDFKKLCSSIAPDDTATINLVMIAGGYMMVAFVKMGVEISSGMDASADSANPEADLKEKEKAKKAAEEADKLEADFNAILRKHKIEDSFKDDAAKPAPKDEREAREQLAILFKDINQCDLLSDIFAFFDKMPGEKSQKSSWKKPGCTQLKDLKIDGDTATAMCGTEKMLFKKFQNRWYIDPEETRRAN